MKRPVLKEHQVREEVWRPVYKYSGRYMVSSIGRVKSILFRQEKILKASKDRWGYFHVSLWGKDGKQLTKKVHRILALSFIGVRSWKRRR